MSAPVTDTDKLRARDKLRGQLVKLKTWLVQTPGPVLSTHLGLLATSYVTVPYMSPWMGIPVYMTVATSLAALATASPLTDNYVHNYRCMFSSKKAAKQVILRAHATLYALGGPAAIRALDHSLLALRSNYFGHALYRHPNTLNTASPHGKRQACTPAGADLPHGMPVSAAEAHDVILRETLFRMVTQPDTNEYGITVSTAPLPTRVQHYVIEHFPEWVALRPEAFTTPYLPELHPELATALACVQGLQLLPEERVATVQKWLNRQEIAESAPSLPSGLMS